MIHVRHQLKHLAQAYSHQDFDLDAPTPLDVVRLFAGGEPPATVGELASDIESVLASPMSGMEMRGLWIDEHGASYDPLTDGIEYRCWFAEILGVLGSS
jgi:hypothetical protein